MPHNTTLLVTIAAGLGFAFMCGLAAQRLRLPPLVGYLVAGIVVGPFTPGVHADTEIASQLAEIGVILLMFGVGLHFSLGDLLAVRRIAVPGALGQIAVATALGAAVAHAWGWSWGTGVVFGLALSVASTVVLLRALEARGTLDSMDGRIAVGWLIVEDLATVLALVLLPALAVPLGGTAPDGVGGSLVGAVALTLGKVAAFLAIMLLVGRRAVPWLLEHVARTGSRELFTLCVLAVALGIAVGAAALFDVSLALGAFFAGVVINESDLSYQAAADALPLQDAFAVLFFVSVGMLFDPSILLRQPLPVLAVVAIVVFGKSLAAFAIVLLFRYPLHTALTISASLAQIGEFSFILGALGVSLGLMPAEAQSLLVAGALLSIALNPLVFAGIRPVDRWLRAHPRWLDALERPGADANVALTPAVQDTLRDHAVLVGHGRVGSTVGEALARCGIPYVVIERDRRTVEALRRSDVRAISGDATRPVILGLAHPERARLLVIAMPDPYQARQVVEVARHANPAIETVVRTHGEAEQVYFERLGVSRAVMGERELALGMAHYSLRALGRSDDEADVVLQAIRDAARERRSAAKAS
jgi:monovalent cation:H+ antiporter-2, CPA2 family